MTAYLQVSDLEPFADIPSPKAVEMIADAEAMAVTVAPCLADSSDLSSNQVAAVKAVLRGAVLRWHEAGTGAFQSKTTGPFSVQYDTRQQRRSMFWPSEIEQLQAICQAVSGGGGAAFAVDTIATTTLNHSPICAINFGAPYCSCGAALTGDDPLYEQ